MKIFVSAAEASSDTHAAEALTRLKALVEKRESGGGAEIFEAFGVAGPKSRTAGVKALVPAEDLLVMGFAEVVTRIPRIRRQLDYLENAVREQCPDVALLCDYPDFHFRLAKRLRALGVPVVCFIPPKVWVWRKSRLKTMASLYTRVLSILPFERSTYEGSGVPFQYVGNPLIDELPLTMSRESARMKLGIADEEEALLLMVGSRPSELRYHLEPMLEAAAKIALARAPKRVRVLLPLPETADRGRFEARVRELPQAARLDLRMSSGDAWIAMKAADAGIIKSGTSSLEAAILDCPHTVVYEAHAVSKWIFQNVVRYRGAISLTNLILSDGKANAERVVPELILGEFSPKRMAEEALRVFPGAPGRGPMLRKFSELRERLVGDAKTGSPSLNVAQAILAVADSHRARKRS